MVLTAMPISEYDKRITILTKERGKISAFARGARRPNSQLPAATNPFSFGEFELFEGKSSYNVSKASIHNYFRDLTLDVDAAYMGFYFLEFAEYVCQENNDEKEMLKLLYQSMRALESPNFSKALVRVIFELKAMTINGEGPSMFSCMHCHKIEELVHFSVRRGGMF
jgi:DNA repair protein RecO (recombination protein O)